MKQKPSLEHICTFIEPYKLEKYQILRNLCPNKIQRYLEILLKITFNIKSYTSGMLHGVDLSLQNVPSMLAIGEGQPHKVFVPRAVHPIAEAKENSDMMHKSKR